MSFVFKPQAPSLATREAPVIFLLGLQAPTYGSRNASVPLSFTGRLPSASFLGRKRPLAFLGTQVPSLARRDAAASLFCGISRPLTVLGRKRPLASYLLVACRRSGSALEACIKVTRELSAKISMGPWLPVQWAAPGAPRILPIARIRASDQLSCLRRQLLSKLHLVSMLLQIGTFLHLSFVSNLYRIVISAQLWANPASPSDETKR